MPEKKERNPVKLHTGPCNQKFIFQLCGCLISHAVKAGQDSACICVYIVAFSLNSVRISDEASYLLFSMFDILLLIK